MSEPEKTLADIELELKKQELLERRQSSRPTFKWTALVTPNVLAIVGAALAASYQLFANRQLEQDKFENQMLVMAVQQPTEENRRAFLQLLLDIGSFSPAKSERIKSYLKSKQPLPQVFAGSATFPTPKDLAAVMPRSTDKAGLVTSLVDAMKEFDINTPQRQAAFLAQIAFETGELQFNTEVWKPTEVQKRYDPPGEMAKLLGNTEPGDGFRFRGRGPFLFTGRALYRRVGQALGEPLEDNPDRLNEPSVAARAAAWRWKSLGLNEIADTGDFRKVTKQVNGGYSGLAERERYYQKALSVLKSSGEAGVGKLVKDKPTSTDPSSAK